MSGLDGVLLAHLVHRSLNRNHAMSEAALLLAVQVPKDAEVRDRHPERRSYEVRPDPAIREAEPGLNEVMEHHPLSFGRGGKLLARNSQRGYHPSLALIAPQREQTSMSKEQRQEWVLWKRSLNVCHFCQYQQRNANSDGIAFFSDSGMLQSFQSRDLRLQPRDHCFLDHARALLGNDRIV